MSTPREIGFRMPGEWEEQEAVWLSWPLNSSAWPGTMAEAQKTFAEIAAAISRFEKVCLNCIEKAQPETRRLLEETGAVIDRVIFYNHPTDDAWCRDHGPVFIKKDQTGEMAIVDWRYNGWGGRFPPWDQDDAVPHRIAEALGLRRFAPPLVCEGGAIESNGRELLLTTESVLLNPNRNPELSRPEVESILRDFLGADAIAWLPAGLEGDDTGGHIDNLARFFKPDGIVAVIERESKRPNYRVLNENRERLETLRTPSGGHFDLAFLGQPEPVWTEEAGVKRLLTASYANFAILNGAVIVPAFGQTRNDAQAAGLLGELFPGREIISINCLDLLREGGALHCITRQQPTASNEKIR